MSRIEVVMTGDIPDDEDPEEFADRVAGWAASTATTQVMSMRIEETRVIDD